MKQPLKTNNDSVFSGRELHFGGKREEKEKKEKKKRGKKTTAAAFLAGA